MKRRPVTLLPSLLAASAIVTLGLVLLHASDGFRPRSFADGPLLPAVVLPSTKTHLGTIGQGEVRYARFAVRNAGQRRLILTNVKEQCCGESSPEETTILSPGQSAELVVKVDTTRWCGALRETVPYLTNDPRRPRFELAVEAHVQVPQ